MLPIILLQPGTSQNLLAISRACLAVEEAAKEGGELLWSVCPLSEGPGKHCLCPVTGSPSPACAGSTCPSVTTGDDDIYVGCYKLRIAEHSRTCVVDKLVEVLNGGRGRERGCLAAPLVAGDRNFHICTIVHYELRIFEDM